MQKVEGRQIAGDVQPAQGRGKIQRRAVHALPELAGHAQSVGRGGRVERRVEVLAYEAGAAGSCAQADGLGLEQDDFHAGGGERPGAGTAGQTTADDDDAGLSLLSERRIRWPAGPRNAIEPEGNPANG